MPGTSRCIDSALMNGAITYNWHMMNALNKDHYQDSLTKCTGHGLPILANTRYLAESVYVDGYVYTCGGYNRASGRDFRTCAKLNLATKTYESMATMNRFRRHMSLNYIEDKIYAFGGHRYNGDLNGNPVENIAFGHPCEDTVEIFDIELNTWSFGTSHPVYGIHR